MPQHDPPADDPDATPGLPPAESPRADTPRADTPRADTPRADTPRADTPRADTPRADTPLPVPVPLPGVDADEPPAVPSGRFGTPGRPLRRSSFLVGFTGALGVLLAYTLYLGVRNAGGILVLVVIALFLAVGLYPAVARLRRWGCRTAWRWRW
ncbi:hypothetical protein GCM10027614_34730 [Micromonospora vulcania]